jgi:hypothetical protein
MLVDPRTFRRIVGVRDRLLAEDDRSIAQLAAEGPACRHRG